MTPILEARNLGKSFGGVHAVNGVSLQLTKGEIFGLIGPNGAGKTTLFNLISGVIKPDRGQVLIGGVDVTGKRPYDVVHYGLSRTHQVVKPLEEMTVLDNVVVGACFGPENQKLAQASKTAEESLDTVGLSHQSDALAGELNIAGKKRLEIARALAARPKLMLLDETLAGLNPTEAEKMINTVRLLRDERGITIVMIEHLMQVIMSLSDRVMVLNFGEELARGTPEEVASNEAVIEAYLGDPDLAERLREDT